MGRGVLLVLVLTLASACAPASDATVVASEVEIPADGVAAISTDDAKVTLMFTHVCLGPVSRPDRSQLDEYRPLAEKLVLVDALDGSLLQLSSFGFRGSRGSNYECWAVDRDAGPSFSTIRIHSIPGTRIQTVLWEEADEV